MAFVHDHSDVSKNLGQWYPITFDEERKETVELRIRRLGREERKKIEKPFLRVRKQRRGGKVIEVPNALLENYGIEAALFMWTDIKNGYVRPEDNGSVEFYKKELGQFLNHDEAIEIGKDVRLDGRLTREIKLRLIDQDNAIANFISEKGILIDEGFADEDIDKFELEEVATENL